MPSPSVTSTLPAPAMRPEPLSQSTLFFLNRNSTPLVSWATEVAFWAIIWTRFSFGATSMPSSAKWLAAASYISEACNRALDGMQPTFRQVPPSVAPPSTPLSTQATFSPSWPARIAAL